MIGKGIARAMTAFIVVACVVSAVLGWAVIEGCIWLFRHVSIGWTA